MPVFRPRTRVEILRDMIAKVIARGSLSALRKNSGVYHVLSAAADEDAEQYFQIARLRDVFSIDSATGSDLHARAAEIATDATLLPIAAQKAASYVVFSRQGTIGTVVIASGSVVAASDNEGLIRFSTTVNASILAGSAESSLVPVIAEEAGTRGNVAAETISRMETRIAGITGVTNPAAVTSGRAAESDPAFRARIKQHVQRMSRGTVYAIESYARAVRLTNGQRVLFARVVEPVVPNGTLACYIDDGTGTTDVYEDGLIDSDDILLASAVGGETLFTTNQRPIRDGASFYLTVDGVGKVQGTDYELNPSTGAVELVTPLTVGQQVKANYFYYIGLVQEVQKVINGDPDDRQNYPGVRAGATRVNVLPPTRVLQSVVGQISVFGDYDVTVVTAAATSEIQAYINGLDIGEFVLVSRLYEAVMGVAGVQNFALSELSGSTPPVDQIILPTQVARIASAAISIV